MRFLVGVAASLIHYVMAVIYYPVTGGKPINKVRISARTAKRRTAGRFIKDL
jgi:hypothetical protein